VAIYDGDVQEEIRKLNPTWPLAFLPGHKAVEGMFRDLAEQELPELAKRLGRTDNELAVALGRLRGLDDHDWFEELARALHISYSELMHACYEQWIDDPWAQAHIENFLLDLERAVR
jgi:hypothetical protein